MQITFAWKHLLFLKMETITGLFNSNIFNMLKHDRSICCRWAWQMSVWLWACLALVSGLESDLSHRKCNTEHLELLRQFWQGSINPQQEEYCIYHRGPFPLLHTANTLFQEKHRHGHYFPWWVLTRPGLGPVPAYSGESMNSDVPTFPSLPESKFSADQFVYKVKLWEFRVQPRITE